MLLFILTTLMTFGYAEGAVDRCELELTARGPMPVIDYPYTLKDPLKISDFAPEIEWESLFGRTLRIQHRSQTDNRILRSSQQRFLTREALLAQFPDVAGQVEKITAEQAKRRTEFNQTKLWMLVRALRLFRSRVQILDQFYPGEFGMLSMRKPTELWQSDLISSFDQHRSLFGRLFFLNFDPLVRDLKEHLSAYAREYNGLPRPLLKIYLVHNHPGPINPLSSFDLKAQKGIAALLEQYDDTFAYQVTFVALGNFRSVGDVAFVRTIRRGDEVTSSKADSVSSTNLGRNRLPTKLRPPLRR